MYIFCIKIVALSSFAYNITDNVRVRGLVRYISFEEDAGVDDAFQYSAGVNYRF